MNKKEPHIFNAQEQEWQPHPVLPKVQFKLLEDRTTHPFASIMLVIVEPGGIIETHIHPKETETVYLLEGEAVLTFGENGKTALTAASGCTVPSGLPHGLYNDGTSPVKLLAIHTPPVR
jgi:quercetin dioxygenase-like cupin family protein